MTIQEFFKLVKAGQALLIDVREENELKESGIIELAEWHPCSKMNDDCEVWSAIVAKFPKDKKIGFYCKSGMRSGRVAELLRMSGFDTLNLGAFDDWKNAGIPVRSFS